MNTIKTSCIKRTGHPCSCLRCQRKAFIELLNNSTPHLHKHNQYHAITRPYGLYLFHQDREKFNVDFEEWRNHKVNK